MSKHSAHYVESMAELCLSSAEEILFLSSATLYLSSLSQNYLVISQ